MRKLFLPLFILFTVFSVFMNIPASAAGEEPLFLLGQNEKAEIQLATGQVFALKIGRNPIQLLTGNQGQKLILCGGQEEKSGEVKQGASLLLVAGDFQSCEKQIQCDSALVAFEVSKDSSVIWLATQGGMMNKEIIKPKIYRVDLNSFSATETVLDSLPCQIALSGDDKRLAVACLGDKDDPSSVLTVWDANTSQQVASFEIAANPGILSFNNENNYIMVAGYGYQEPESTSTGVVTGFKIPAKYFKQLKKPAPSGVNIINLATLDNRLFDLGRIAEDFIQGQSGIIYSIAKDENQSIVRATNWSGLLWEKRYDSLPKYVQEWPDKNRVFIICGKKISIISNDDGKTLKELTAENDIQPFLFWDSSPYAYSYNMSKLRLNTMDLNDSELGKTFKAGSAGLKILKATTMVLSVVAYADSLQPRYVNGVQMPTRVTPIYWPHAPKGNIVPCPEQEKLYMLNSFLAEIYTYDIQKEVVTKKFSYLGDNSLYLQMTPHGKYVVLVTGGDWKLINTKTDKADLTFGVGGGIHLVFQEVTAPTPYFSPDGNKMYIPKGSQILVVDLLNGKKLKSLPTKTKDATLFW